MAISANASSRAVAGGAPRVFPAGKLPNDARLGPLKDLNGYFPFAPPATPEAWQARAEKVRRQLLVSQGLWPMPERTPANPVIHGEIDLGDYTVEKVFFESYPGHFVTGNLYRPKGAAGVKNAEGRRPAVLSPHGHWLNGRFYDQGAKEIRKAIVNGEERFEDSGRSPLQARCAQLARMGCVVFHYDMLGMADSRQIVHNPGVREAMNTTENWGFFSPQAELRLQNMMGLQTYNSIRALDFLSELPDVDPARIAVTGASGGGTQTFMLGALDPRPKVAFPAVMVSTAMQGGCTCENACGLRVDTGNVEIAALFAPKPLGMTAADDWTREIATKGLPELQTLYEMLGVRDHVMARPLLQFGHNYNYVSRAVMYSWLNQHLGLGLEEPVVEEDYQRLSREQLTVWDDEHPLPPTGDEYERSLLRYLTETSNQQLAALEPRDAEGLERYRGVVGAAFDVLIGRDLPAAGEVTHELASEEDRGDYLEFTGTIDYAKAGESLPALMLQPKKWNRHVAIWLDGEGKQGLYDSSGELSSAIKKLLAEGTAIVGADLLYQGEFLDEGKPLERQRMVGDGKRPNYAGYTFGYNPTLFARRVHDVLSLVSFAAHHETAPARIDLVGVNGAGPIAAVAALQVGDKLGRLAIDTRGFRFASANQLDDVNLWPGSVKYGDLPAILALIAPRPIWVAGEQEKDLPLVQAAYQAAASRENLQIDAAPSAERGETAATWLLKE
ncbi:MAG: acetylxylan esterase [Pirellulales bacterium]|nr:acetylxylan esterase [Pirellulales bacterium]